MPDLEIDLSQAILEDVEVEDLKLRTAVIRTSDRNAFRSCRRKWNWSSHLRQNLGPKQAAGPLWFGSGFHFAMEDFHGYRRFANPVDALQEYYRVTKADKPDAIPDDAEELFNMGKAMLDYYQKWLDARPRTFPTYYVDGKPQLEVNCRIKMPMDPALLRSYGYDEAVYSLTIDKVVIDPDTDELWLVDYKTAKVFNTSHFQVDSQVTTYCVPLSSEILTKQGWRTYDQLSVGDEVMGYNIDTGLNEWTILEAINLPGKQTLQKIYAKSFSFECTPDHNWVQRRVGNGKQYEWQKRPLDGKRGTQVLMSAPFAGGNSTVSCDEAALMGWILTEGTWGRYDRGERASVSQKKFASKLQDLLDKFPGCYTRISDFEDTKVWHFQMDFIRKLFAKCGLLLEPKDSMQGLDQFVLGLTKVALDAFCAAAYAGDGDQNNHDFFQNEGPLLNAFKLAFFLQGHFCTANRETGPKCRAFTLGTALKRSQTILRESIEPADVWCPTTKLGTWIMRQGDQIVITGNCWAARQIYDLPVSGMIYSQHLKREIKKPRVLASGHLSTALNQATSSLLYKEAMIDIYGSLEKSPEAITYFYDNLRKTEDARQDIFVRHDYLNRSQTMCDSEGQKILMEAEEMLNPRLPLYPNPSYNCTNMCSFASACVSADDGGHYEDELATNFQSRPAEYDGWRKLIAWPDEKKPIQPLLDWNSI